MINDENNNNKKQLPKTYQRTPKKYRISTFSQGSWSKLKVYNDGKWKLCPIKFEKKKNKQTQTEI